MNFFKKKATEASKVYNAYRRLFSTDDGKTVLNDLMKCCYVHRPTIGQTPEETYFNEGQRAVVIRILETSNKSSEEINTMIKAMVKQENDLLGGANEYQ